MVVEGLMACMDPSGIPRLNLEEVGLPSEDTIDAVALLQWRPGKNGGCVTDRDEAISVFVMKKGKVHSQASPSAMLSHHHHLENQPFSLNQRTSIVRWRNAVRN